MEVISSAGVISLDGSHPTELLLSKTVWLCAMQSFLVAEDINDGFHLGYKQPRTPALKIKEVVKKWTCEASHD